MARRKVDMVRVREIDAELAALVAKNPNIRPMNAESLAAALDPAPEIRQEAFKTDEAAKILGIHPERLRQLVRAGEIPAARLGKSWRISRVALADYFRRVGGGELWDD